MEYISSYEAKTHLPQLLKRVHSGAQIVITKHHTPIAMLIPFGISKKQTQASTMNYAI
ncbi:MAG: type II toxin-antitoxin system Phd/YefM family antitoxin [Gammaproteobacteria bacterium]